MARTNRIKAEGDAFYHVTSRITGKRFLLQKPSLKAKMLDILERSARFSGIKIGAFCIMDDHFHLLFEVPAVDPGTLPESEILDRIEILRGKKEADRIHDRWEALRERGDSLLAEADADRYRRRMYDISQFMKTFLEYFGRAFRAENEYAGRLWGDRYFSTLVESAEYLSRCATYVELNPVRAGMTTRATDYAWNTSGLAERGNVYAISCRRWLAVLAGVTGGISTRGDSHFGEVCEEGDSHFGKGLCGGDSHSVEAWMMKRQPQLSKGKLLGSYEFVNKAAGVYANALGSVRAWAHEMEGAFFASHGYRLAMKTRQAA